MNVIKRAKRELRDEVLSAVQKMSEKRKAAENREITRRVTDYLASSGITSVMSFLSMTGEVDTGPIMRWAHMHDMFVSIPRIAPGSSEMSFRRYDSNSLEVHPFGFRQPTADAEIFDPHQSAKNRTLMLVPGAAFTAEGMRLGRGGGYYDKFLEKYANVITTAGICFSLQMCDAVPTQPHDMRLDMIFTATEGDR
jgi:5-formyltetrahydrofolate cyclo-ligase